MSCYDCLALDALVDDDGPFSALSATWSYSAGNSHLLIIFSSLQQIQHKEGSGYFKGYKDSDTGK